MNDFNYKTVVETFRNHETEFGEIIDQLKKSHTKNKETRSVLKILLLRQPLILLLGYTTLQER